MDSIPSRISSDGSNPQPEELEETPEEKRAQEVVEVAIESIPTNGNSADPIAAKRVEVGSAKKEATSPKLTPMKLVEFVRKLYTSGLTDADMEEISTLTKRNSSNFTIKRFKHLISCHKVFKPFRLISRVMDVINGNTPRREFLVAAQQSSNMLGIAENMVHQLLQGEAKTAFWAIIEPSRQKLRYEGAVMGYLAQIFSTIEAANNLLNGTTQPEGRVPLDLLSRSTAIYNTAMESRPLVAHQLARHLFEVHVKGHIDELRDACKEEVRSVFMGLLGGICVFPDRVARNDLQVLQTFHHLLRADVHELSTENLVRKEALEGLLEHFDEYGLGQLGLTNRQDSALRRLIGFLTNPNEEQNPIFAATHTVLMGRLFPVQRTRTAN